MPESLLISILLGIVEGLTEFLPISSTGHLILVGHLCKMKGELAATFEIAIQSGAILAVVVVYYQHFLAIFRPVSKEKFSGWRAGWLLVLTTLPAVFIGPIVHGTIKAYLFNPTSVAIALVIGGIALIIVEKFQLSVTADALGDITPRIALSIGFWQCLALWPGMSRSGATIIGGMFLGLERRLAAKYSFLAAVPVLLAATVYELYKSADALGFEYINLLLVGTLVAFITAVLAIKTFMRILQHFTLAPFGYYRIFLGLLFFYFYYDRMQ